MIIILVIDSFIGFDVVVCCSEWWYVDERSVRSQTVKSGFDAKFFVTMSY